MISSLLATSFRRRANTGFGNFFGRESVLVCEILYKI